MNHFPLQSSNFIDLEADFKTWLAIVGYTSRTVYGTPLYIHQLLYFLENTPVPDTVEGSMGKGITHITQLTKASLRAFIDYLTKRPNLRRDSGGLRFSSINKHISCISLFSEYLHQTQQHFLDAPLPRFIDTAEPRVTLTIDEVKQLYEATSNPACKPLEQRDRAMLCIFYGCGLRKNEGLNLNVGDIDFKQQLLFVSMGKGYKQRYVPLTPSICEDIKIYLEQGRRSLLKEESTEAFFLTLQGRRMQKFNDRLLVLKNKTSIEKQFSLHNLRHSIATHLLQGGMELEKIAKFLGHSSLESTQIYTHVVSN